MYSRTWSRLGITVIDLDHVGPLGELSMSGVVSPFGLVQAAE
jgi:hypothetical protein